MKVEADKKLRVAIIEDSKTMLVTLKGLIGKTAGMEVCGTWESAEAALPKIHTCEPDVVLVDLELPGMHGHDCIRILSAVLPCAAFVVLTIHDDAECVFGAIEAGANGYLLKNSQHQEIIDGIHMAHKGGSPLSPAVASMVIRAFQKNPPKKPTVPLPSLSPRERQILDHLAKGSVPKEAAADLGISYETVRDYLKQIYQKLHVRSRTEAVLRYIDAKQA